MEDYYCRKCKTELSRNNLFCPSCLTSSFVTQRRLSVCDICGEHIDDINKHIANWHPTCEICHIDYKTKSEFDEHIRYVHLCEVCSKQFKNLKEKKLHYDSHPKCEICGNRVMFLEDHINSCHPTCEICNARFNTKSEFDEHYRTVHLCDICGIEFISIEERDVHKNSHPKCEICGTQVMFLKNHLNSCHPKCEFCGKMLETDDKLKKHINEIHLCKCGEIFRTLEERDNHLEKHTCIYCNLILDSISSFKEHHKKHHLCIVCGRTFKNMVQRNRHINVSPSCQIKKIWHEKPIHTYKIVQVSCPCEHLVLGENVEGVTSYCPKCKRRIKISR